MPTFTPDHNGECIHCDEPLDAHDPSGACPPRFIVGEVSCNYINGRAISPVAPIARSFESLVNVNHERGYRLVCFSLHRLMTRPDELNETIVAVFEQVEPTRVEGES